MDPSAASLDARSKPLSKVSLGFFVGIHLACLLALVVGVRWIDVALCVGLYWLRMFGITAGYHRYFAHRAYRTSRLVQLVLAWIGASATQKGPLWWASWHRVHHRWSDLPRDVHSPHQRGMLYAHVGWIVGSDHDATDLSLIPDYARYPELRWINRYFWVSPLSLALACLAVDGWRGVIWGYVISTVVLWHGTFTINSLAHTWGSRRYETTDTSRNNPWLAIITMGEGWHNNHHHYMNSVKQGFFWWEIDASYYVLRLLSYVGVVWDLRLPPKHVLQEKLAQAGGRIALARQAAETRLAEVKVAAETRLAKVTDAMNDAVEGPSTPPRMT